MDLNHYIDQKRDANLKDLCELLRIPSVSAQTQHKPDIESACKWVADRCRRAGLDKVEIVPTKLHPLVYGESLRAPRKPTVLFYGHYDVQPPEPLDLWTSPPFEPTVRDGNLFGRGTADDKGQVHIHLSALDALRQIDGNLPINVKVLIEGEEEVGSESLWSYVQENKAQAESRRARRISQTPACFLPAAYHPSPTAYADLNYYEIGTHWPGAGFALWNFRRRRS